MGCSSSRTTPAWIPFTGCSPSGTGCSSVGPPQGHKPCQQTCSNMGSSLHRSTDPGRSLLQRRVPTGSQPHLGIHLLWCGVASTGYRWISAPPWTIMGCRGTTCLTMIFITSCKERLSAPTFRAPPPRPSSQTLVSAELFVSHSFTPLSSLLFHCRVFPPLLKYVITEALPPLLIGLALTSGRSVLELAGTGFYKQCIELYHSYYYLIADTTFILESRIHDNVINYYIQLAGTIKKELTSQSLCTIQA